MALLFDEDYALLRDSDIEYAEDQAARQFVFLGFVLPDGIYRVERCDVLVMIPPNYNVAGNDMFWTFPRLIRADGHGIPQTCEIGGGDNRRFGGREFCRWSRHWDPQKPGVWRPGHSNIISIHRRIDWALRNPTP